MKRFTILLALLTACASVPAHSGRNEATSQVMKDAALCLRTGPCTVFQVENHNNEPANVYVNGAWFGFIGAQTPRRPVFVQNWRLGAEQCARITVRFQITGARAGSDRACVRPGEFYDLTIEQPAPGWTANVWLVPRPGA